MGRWEEAVVSCDAGLAREVVEIAAVVKGYGDVRPRMMAALERLLGEALPAAVQSARDAGEGHTPRPAQILGEARRLVLADERGIDAVGALLDGARDGAAGKGNP
jgi:hypothetical protein